MALGAIITHLLLVVLGATGEARRNREISDQVKRQVERQVERQVAEERSKER